MSNYETIAVNLPALRRLRKHMRKHHSHALDRMLANDPTGKVHDFAFGGRNGGELATLHDACCDPERFPVYVLADDAVVALIKKVQRGTVASLWVHAARTIWRVWD